MSNGVGEEELSSSTDTLVRPNLVVGGKAKPQYKFSPMMDERGALWRIKAASLDRRCARGATTPRFHHSRRGRYKLSSESAVVAEGVLGSCGYVWLVDLPSCLRAFRLVLDQQGHFEPRSACPRPSEAGMGDNDHHSYGYPANYEQSSGLQYPVNAQSQEQRPMAYQQRQPSAAYAPYYTPAPISYNSHGAEAQPGQQYSRDAHDAQMSNYQYDQYGRQYAGIESNARNLRPYPRDGLQHEQQTRGGYEQEQARSVSYSDERSRQNIMPSGDPRSASMGGLQQSSWTNNNGKNAQPSALHAMSHRMQPNTQHSRSNSREQSQPQMYAGSQGVMRQAPQASSSRAQTNTTQSAAVKQPKISPLNISARRDEQRPAFVRGETSYQPSEYHQQVEMRQSIRPETVSPQIAMDVTRGNPTSFQYKKPQSVAPLYEEQLQREQEVLPLTVDPSQIFDQSEYDRRKQTAEQDVIKAKQSSESPIVSPPAQIELHARSGSNPREDLAAEMRLMFEKMRELKSKDPTLFTEAWETLRKVRRSRFEVLGSTDRW